MKQISLGGEPLLFGGDPPYPKLKAMYMTFQGPSPTADFGEENARVPHRNPRIKYPTQSNGNPTAQLVRLGSCMSHVTYPSGFRTESALASGTAISLIEWD